MRRKSALPELLAPAGDMQALYAAVEAGADAIYVGGKRFGARAFAKNFDDEELALAVKYCHLHGVRLYVTVNTLVFDREMQELADYAAMLWEIGVDAVIVADLGAVRVIRQRVPKMELHASTQMSVHNTEGARVASKLGCTRVVVARELSYSDICEITESAPTETEVFLHGALCVSHSGQCLFSSLVGGRSGNRGECAQPCRLPYNGGKYPLSLSDLSLANHIVELISSGTASLKIEGRMKSADYVYAVTSIYRRLLDDGRNATPKEQTELARIFSRGGFTDGYFSSKLDTGMIGVRSEAEKSATKELSGRVFSPMKKRVFAKAKFVIGEPSALVLSDGKRTVSAKGECPTAAINIPLDEESLKNRLSKMGNTLLTLDVADIEVELDDGAYLSPGSINALRRSCAEAFECAENREAVAYKKVIPEKRGGTGLKTALFLSPEKLCEIFDDTLRSFDVIFAPLFSDDETFLRANGVYLPPVLRNCDIDKAKERILQLKERGVRYALVGNIGAIDLAVACGLILIGDIRLNVTNSHARAALASLGVESTVVSAELDLPKARDVGGAITVYGRIPLMLTERCFIKENFSCVECSRAALTDRRGKVFPIFREYAHRNLILNSDYTYMADKMKSVRDASLSSHFIFTTESAGAVKSVVFAFSRELPIETIFPGERPRRVGMREVSQKDKKR